MKKTLVVSVSVLLLVILAACDYESADYYRQWQGLHMYVAEGSVTPSGLRLSMQNDNDELFFGHGVMFTIDLNSRKL